jgi:hypothetical protein
VDISHWQRRQGYRLLLPCQWYRGLSVDSKPVAITHQGMMTLLIKFMAMGYMFLTCSSKLQVLIKEALKQDFDKFYLY